MPKKLQIKKKVIGFSQKAFVFRKDGNFLTLRRTDAAPSNPLKWDLPGGDLDFGEDPLESIMREIQEESGLVAKKLAPFGVEAHITSLGSYWITLAYTAVIAKGKLSISWEHDLYKWVTIDEFLKLSIPKKLRKFAIDLKNKNKL